MASDTVLASSVGHVDAATLSAISSLAQDLKARIFRLVDARAGQRVLDVGCGPGLDLPALSAAAGSDGVVVGIDADPQMVRDAEARSHRAGHAGAVAHFVGDALALPFRDGVFDRCRCERVLQHVHEPKTAVRELFRVARVDGLVVTADSDWGSLSIDCDDIDLERRIVRAVSGQLANGYAGRELVRLMRGAGCEIVGVEVQPVWWTSFARFRATSFPATGVVDALLGSGGLSSADWNRFVAACERAEQQAAFFASAAVVVVAGRKRS
jgi:SAM-dependent methyltransferase